MIIKFKDLDEKLDDLYMSNGNAYDENITEEIISEKEKIVLYSPLIKIFGLKINLRIGEYFVFDKEDNDFYPDFTLTAILNDNNEIIYWEQDNMITTVYNYFHGEKTLKQIENALVNISDVSNENIAVTA